MSETHKQTQSKELPSKAEWGVKFASGVMIGAGIAAGYLAAHTEAHVQDLEVTTTSHDISSVNNASQERIDHFIDQRNMMLGESALFLIAGASFGIRGKGYEMRRKQETKQEITTIPSSSIDL